MGRFRPLRAALAVSCFCAFLQGAVAAKIDADAGWMQATSVVFLFTLPVAALAGLAFGFLAPMAARGPRGLPAGSWIGILVHLAPLVALRVAPHMALPVTLILLVAAGAGLAVWARVAEAPLVEPPGLGHFGLLVGVLVVFAVVWGAVAPAPAPAIGGVPPLAQRGPAGLGAPNLALVVLDTVRADSFGSYGDPRGLTPRLDDFAASGRQYLHAVAPGSHTPPSHATLFSGLMPHAHGVTSTHVGLSPQAAETLAGRLAARGYATVGVVANFVLRRTRRFQRGFQVYDDSEVCLRGYAAAFEAVTTLTAPGRVYGSLGNGRWTLAKLAMVGLRAGRPAAGAVAVNMHAFAHLESARESGGPVFLFVNYMDTHAPYPAPAEFRERLVTSDPGPFAGLEEPAPFQAEIRRLQAALAAGEAAPETLAALAQMQAAALAHLDARVGELVDAFAAASGDRPWRVVVTSDHGEHFGEHGLLGHGQGLWEETQHVPLLVFGSDVEPARIEAPVSLRDVGATLLFEAGDLQPFGAAVPLPTGERGGASPAESGFVAAEHADPTLHRWFAPLELLAVYAGTEKRLFAVPATAAEVASAGLEARAGFVLDRDPHELDARQLPLAPGLAAWLDGWMVAYRAGLQLSRAAEDSAAAGARLAELGYQ